MKLWGGRFSEKTARDVEEFTSSLSFDRRLYSQDITGSIAHARMLGHVGIISGAEADCLVAGLERVRSEIGSDGLKSSLDAEDIHSYVEARLTELVGPVAGKLHTGRSRNDQVALDERLFLKEKLPEVVAALEDMQRSLLETAEKHRRTPLPGFTHLQHAQPVLLAHHMLAYVEMMQRDAGRVTDALSRLDVLPLGSGALAGTTFPIDREFVARELGFASVSANSMDSVSDRDHIVETLAALALIMTHLGRLAEEIVLWSTPEFAFVEVGDAYATGSSIMPQKKNPDVAELVRGRCGRVYGSLMGMLTVLKGLPMTYNRDLQEDKEPLFDALDTTLSSLSVFAAMLRSCRFDPERMSLALEGDFSDATDMADYLVRRGLSFREAHEVVGRLVRLCVEQKVSLSSLGLDVLKRFSSSFEEDVREHLGTMNIINARSHKGGTAGSAVDQELLRHRRRLF